MNIGEEFVASYLRHIKGCDFTQQNLYTVDIQGEIDVVGVNLKERKVYFCEVAIHLATGLQYTKDGRPDNVRRITEKIRKDISYARTYFKDYSQHFMFWSPIVKATGVINNQVRDIAEIGENISRELDDKFMDCLSEMRGYAGQETKELKCPVLRILQIEEHLQKHLEKQQVR